MRRDERARFDRIFEEVLGALPPRIHALIEEVPVALEDHPPRALLEEMGIDPDDRSALCGVHSGVPLTERSVDRHELPRRPAAGSRGPTTTAPRSGARIACATRSA